jgi:DNA-binding CsgD family transcriptional regulator
VVSGSSRRELSTSCLKGSDMAKRKSGKKKTARRKSRPRGRTIAVKVARPGKIHLTPREEQLLRLVSLGCSVKEISAILDIAPSTADNHKARLMAKLGTDKAVLVTRLAIQYGVSSMDDRLTAAEQRASGRSHDGWN